MAGSNVIEFRMVRKWSDATKTTKVDERLQFRTKDVLISILGVDVGTWSDWKDFDAIEVVDVIVG